MLSGWKELTALTDTCAHVPGSTAGRAPLKHYIPMCHLVLVSVRLGEPGVLHVYQTADADAVGSQTIR